MNRQVAVRVRLLTFPLVMFACGGQELEPAPDPIGTGDTAILAAPGEGVDFPGPVDVFGERSPAPAPGGGERILVPRDGAARIGVPEGDYAVLEDADGLEGYLPDDGVAGWKVAQPRVGDEATAARRR